MDGRNEFPIMIKTKNTENTTGEKTKPERHSRLDRRSGEDRRKSYSLDYFLKGGIERRKGTEQRKQGERRSDWLRIDEWYSVYIGSD
jgi:hypothetical protein